MAGPVAGVPFSTAQIITTVEELGKGDPAKLRDSKKGRSLHLYHQAALRPTTLHFGGCFAIKSIGCPGFACYILNAMRAEHCLKRCHAFDTCLDFTARWQVVIRCPLVSHRSGYYDRMPNDQAAIKDACATTGDEFPASLPN